MLDTDDLGVCVLACVLSRRAITDKEGKPTFSNGRKGRFNNSKLDLDP